MKKKIVILVLIFGFINLGISSELSIFKKYSIYRGKYLLNQKEKLNLSEGQINKINNLILDYLEKSIKKQSQIKIQELRFLYLMKRDKVDREELKKIIRNISNLKTDYIIMYFNYLLNCKNVLKQKQIDILINLSKHGR